MAAPLVPLAPAMAPAAPAMGVVTSSVQSVTAPRARLAPGTGPVPRISIPYPPFFALPGEQEITTTQTQHYVQAAPYAIPAMPVYAPAPAAPVHRRPPRPRARRPRPPAAAAPPAQAVPPITQENIEELEKRLQLLKKIVKERDAQAAPQQAPKDCPKP